MYSTTPEQIKYTYDALGNKLYKKVFYPNLTSKVTKYINGFVYEDNVFKYYPTEEGYIEPDGNGNFNYIYQYKDHLGNIRLSYKEGEGSNGLEIVEENNYYPFGGLHKGYNGLVSANVNSIGKNYKYNGKELNKELGLDWYDYRARNYDAALGRFFNVDPLAEAMSSYGVYTYTFNNPITYNDPTGMFPEDVDGQDPPDWYDGGELDTVYLTGTSPRDNWSSEIGDWDYPKSPSEYQDDYPEFDGMTLAEMNDHYDERGYRSAYRSWTQEYEGNMRLGAFINRMKLGLYDNGYLETMEWAIGAGGLSNASSALSRSSRAFLEGGAGAYGNAMKQGSRVFWSGGEKAMNTAADYARANGMTTLEMTRAGQNITELTRGLPWSEAGPMWQRMSAAYARGANGTVHVFHNSQGVGLQSVWRTVEYPILKKMV